MNKIRLFLLLILLNLSFQSWTKADDIRDFQIEGFSVGDKLSKAMSKKEIKALLPTLKLLLKLRIIKVSICEAGQIFQHPMGPNVLVKTRE